MTLHYHDVEQGSDEWENLRLGKITASTVKHLMTSKGKVANSESSRAYLYEIASQRASGFVEPQFYGYNMERGHYDERLAIDYYEEHHGPVDRRGFYIREESDWSLGYSPDGETFDGGLIEVKSRLQKFHIRSFVDDCIPDEHIIQCQAGLLVTGKPYLDYMQVCLGWEPFIKRVYPDDIMQAAIIETCIAAEMKVAEIISTYAERSKGVAKMPLPVTMEDIDG